MIQLYQYQHDILINSWDSPYYAWFMETGTGKTVISLENMRWLWSHNKINAAIITAPKTVIRPVWVRALTDFYSSREWNYIIFQWLGGFAESNRRLVEKLIVEPVNNDYFFIFMINIEAFSHKSIYDTIKKILLHWKTIWFVDESTTIKSPTAKRTKGILEISYLAEYRRILSGYPVLKSPEDLYTQLKFLDLKSIPYNSFYAFRNEFTYTKQLDNRVTISLGPRDTTKLRELIEPFTVRVLKKDCLDLPDKVHTIRYVEMTNEQRQLYNQMKTKGYVEVKNSDKTVFATTLLSQLGKLHQIANGMLLDSGTQINCDKYLLLLNLLSSELNDKQVIIWTCYINTTLEVSSRLELAGYEYDYITGQRNMGDRNRAIEDFRNGRKQILVANPSILMHGQNLANCSYAIYFNNSFSLEHRIQSEDRLHRIGQVNKCTYIDLITEDTIEEKVLDKLEHKFSISAATMGDEWESWFN